MKQFISKQSDRYRKAYGTNVKDYPRQCVFFGTTNDYEFLRDYTGNRRFWPVRVREQEPTKSVFDDLPKERDQIWAEAKYRYEHGEPLYLEGELAQRALEVQDEFTFRSSKEEDIANYLDTKLPEDWYEKSASGRCQWLEDEAPKIQVRCSVIVSAVSRFGSRSSEEIKGLLQRSSKGRLRRS